MPDNQLNQQNHSSMKRFLWLPLGIVLLLLSSCKTQLAYNNLDWLIRWQVNGYVTLEKTQKTQLKQYINSQHDWHRKEQLPQYLDSLTQLRQALGEPMSLADIDAFGQKTEQYWHNIIARVLPDLTALVVSLDDKQITELIEEIKEEHEELVDEYGDLSKADLRKRRLKRFRKGTRRWLGGTTDAQWQDIESAVSDFKPLIPHWLENRQRWQTDFFALLKQRDKDDFSQRLRTLLLHPEKSNSKAYADAFQHNRQLSRNLLLRLQQSLTPDQAEHLDEELADLIADLEDLITDS